MIERLQLLIRGRVQGVFFRASTRERAEAIGLAGYVRNLEDGRVEVVVEGTSEQVQALYDYCWQGPPGARVEDVQVQHLPIEGKLSRPFQVIR